MFCENLLEIPKEAFGPSGIHMGNLVSTQIAKQNKGLQTKYNPIAKKITVLNSSDLPPSVLNKILYEPSISSQYKGWYPVVEKERSKAGNLEISFSPSLSSLNNLQQFLVVPLLQPPPKQVPMFLHMKQSSLRSTWLERSFSPLSDFEKLTSGVAILQFIMLRLILLKYIHEKSDFKVYS